MSNGYKMFAKLHPVGGLYRYKGDVNNSIAQHLLERGRLVSITFSQSGKDPRAFQKSPQCLTPFSL